MQQQVEQYIEQIPLHIRTSLFHITYILPQFLAWCSTFTTLLLPLFSCVVNSHTITFYLGSVLIDNNLIQSFTALQTTYHTGCTCSVTGSIVKLFTYVLVLSTTAHTVLTGLRLSDKLHVLQAVTLFQAEQYTQPAYIISLEVRTLLVTLLLYTCNIYLYGSQCYDVVRDTADVSGMNNSGYLYNIVCYILLWLALGNIIYQRNTNIIEYNIVPQHAGNDQYVNNTSTYIPPRSYASSVLDQSTLIPTSQYTVEPRSTNSMQGVINANNMTGPVFPPFGQPSSSIAQQQNNL